MRVAAIPLVRSSASSRSEAVCARTASCHRGTAAPPVANADQRIEGKRSCPQLRTGAARLPPRPQSTQPAIARPRTRARRRSRPRSASIPERPAVHSARRDLCVLTLLFAPRIPEIESASPHGGEHPADARSRITGCVARFDTGRSVVQDGASLEQRPAADKQQYPDASSARNDTASLPWRIDTS